MDPKALHLEIWGSQLVWAKTPGKSRPDPKVWTKTPRKSRPNLGFRRNQRGPRRPAEKQTKQKGPNKRPLEKVQTDGHKKEFALPARRRSPSRPCSSPGLGTRFGNPLLVTISHGSGWQQKMPKRSRRQRMAAENPKTKQKATDNIRWHQNEAEGSG